MVQAALAICGPLALGLAVHDIALSLLPAIGGLLAMVVDIGGAYPARPRSAPARLTDAVLRVRAVLA